MGDIYTLAAKLERALVKGTGFQVSASELRVMIDEDIVDAFFAAKLKHLKSIVPAPEGRQSRPGTEQAANR